MVIGQLDSDDLQEVVVRNPPANSKYAALKSATLSRLADSSQQQLLKLFTQLELGDKKPSQLLRHMRSLADGRVTDEVLQIKWRDLLPLHVQRLLKIFKAMSLDELAAAADQLLESAALVAAIDPAQVSTCSADVATPVVQPIVPVANPDCVASELSTLRLVLANVVSSSREILEKLSGISNHLRRIAPAHAGSRSRLCSPAPRDGLCFYHRRFGNNARSSVSHPAPTKLHRSRETNETGVRVGRQRRPASRRKSPAYF